MYYIIVFKIVPAPYSSRDERISSEIPRIKNGKKDTGCDVGGGAFREESNAHATAAGEAENSSRRQEVRSE